MTGIVACIAVSSSAQTVGKVSLSPASVVGGGSAVGTVTITKAAGTAGFVVDLSSSKSSATVSASITVPSGKTTATFDIATIPVAASTVAAIKATSGKSSSSANLTIKPPTVSGLDVSPTSALGGTTLSGTVNISSAAPSAGLPIKLASNSSSATVPATVTIKAGATSATFNVTTKVVTMTTAAKITASYLTSSIGVSVTLNPVKLASVTLNPTSVQGGSTSLGTVSLNGNAGTSGVTVALSSNQTSVTVPSSVTIKSGNSSATFTVTTKSVTKQSVGIITGKLGTVSETASLTVTPAGTNSFPGSYSGSFYSESGSIGTVSFTISTTGAITGTAIDYSTGTAISQSILGSVSSSGAVTVTLTSKSQTNTNTGTFQFNSAGNLVGYFTNPKSADSVPTTVTVNANGKPLEYAGTYSGTVANSDGTGNNISNLTISSTGAITATAQGVSNVSGTINSIGVATVKLTSNSGNQTETIYFAFDTNGFLTGFTTHSAGDTSTFALARSYAGTYTIPIDSQTSALFNVSDTGVVAGSSNSPANPFTVSGTVSSAGVAHIVATPTGGTSSGTATLVGNFYATLGGMNGSGTATVVGGNSGNWTGAGVPAAGLIYAKTYSLSMTNGVTATLSIDEGGYISGSASGINFTGSVSFEGSVVIFGIPTSAGSTVNTATLAGTITKTGNSIAGGGGFFTLASGAGSWTLTSK